MRILGSARASTRTCDFDPVAPTIDPAVSPLGIRKIPLRRGWCL